MYQNENLPFFVEDQHGKNIYTLTNTESFEIRESGSNYSVFMKEQGQSIMLGTYDTEKRARDMLDGLIEAIINNERRYSFCILRTRNWRVL